MGEAYTTAIQCNSKELLELFLPHLNRPFHELRDLRSGLQVALFFAVLFFVFFFLFFKSVVESSFRCSAFWKNGLSPYDAKNEKGQG